MPADFDLEHLALEPLADAAVAGDEDVGEEHHLDLHRARAFTRLAAPTAHVEGKGARRVAALERAGLGGEQRTQLVERLHVRDGVGARRAPDRGLIDQYDVADRLPALERGDLTYRLAEVFFCAMPALDAPL